jgi:hypothetical protein
MSQNSDFIMFPFSKPGPSKSGQAYIRGYTYSVFFYLSIPLSSGVMPSCPVAALPIVASAPLHSGDRAELPLQQ